MAFLPLMKPPPLSREGWSSVREQIAQQPARRRASLPPEERTASWHHVGTRSGMHPVDTPYLTTTRSRSHAPTTEHSVAVDEQEEFHSRPATRAGTSARRYDLTPYAQRIDRRTEAVSRQGKHPILYIGLFLMILVAFLTASTLIPPFLQQWHDESTYGYPRTFQTDANVEHGGVEHFIVLNNHGTIEVLEIPGYPSPTNLTRLYIIVRLSSQGADLVPATVSFPDVNGDGKPDLQVTVLDGSNPSVWILFNNGTTFVPKL
jgi:hypothetical protein